MPKINIGRPGFSARSDAHTFDCLIESKCRRRRGAGLSHYWYLMRGDDTGRRFSAPRRYCKE